MSHGAHMQFQGVIHGAGSSQHKQSLNSLALEQPCGAGVRAAHAQMFVQSMHT